LNAYTVLSSQEDTTIMEVNEVSIKLSNKVVILQRGYFTKKNHMILTATGQYIKNIEILYKFQKGFTYVLHF